VADNAASRFLELMVGDLRYKYGLGRATTLVRAGTNGRSPNPDPPNAAFTGTLGNLGLFVGSRVDENAGFWFSSVACQGNT